MAAGFNTARYLGLAEEVTFGTSVPATVFFDPSSVTIDPAGAAVDVYKGASGFDYLYSNNNYTSGGAFAMPIDDKAIGYLLKWGLCGPTITGSNAGYTKTGSGSVTHTFAPVVGGLMQSFSAHVGKDYFEHVFSGCVIDKMKITSKAGSLVDLSVDILGGKDAKAALPASVTFTPTTLFASHDVTVSIGGSASAKVEGLDMTLGFGADVKSGITMGSRFPVKAYRGALTVDTNITLSFSDTAELERFWGGTSGPVDTVTEFAVSIALGAGMTITLPRAVYSDMKTSVSGRGRITQTGKLVALKLADGSTGPIQITLTNSTTTY